MKKIVLTAIAFIIISSLSAQIKFGPAINIAMSYYSNKTTDLSIEKTVNPAFGLAIEKYLDYWVSLRTLAFYSFENFSISENSNGNIDQIHGQFVDLFIEGVFSDFNETAKLYPYGSTGLGARLNVISKDQNSYLINQEFGKVLPFFSVGVGVKYSTSFNSKIDISINYSRCLTKPINNVECRLNQMSLKVIALF